MLLVSNLVASLANDNQTISSEVLVKLLIYYSAEWYKILKIYVTDEHSTESSGSCFTFRQQIKYLHQHLDIYNN